MNEYNVIECLENVDLIRNQFYGSRGAHLRFPRLFSIMIVLINMSVINTGYLVNGTDISGVFIKYASGTPTTTGLKVAGVDIGTLFQPLSASPGKGLATLTGLQLSSIDMNTIFAARVYTPGISFTSFNKSFTSTSSFVSTVVFTIPYTSGVFKTGTSKVQLSVSSVPSNVSISVGSSVSLATSGASSIQVTATITTNSSTSTGSVTFSLVTTVYDDSGATSKVITSNSIGSVTFSPQSTQSTTYTTVNQALSGSGTLTTANLGHSPSGNITFTLSGAGGINGNDVGGYTGGRGTSAGLFVVYAAPASLPLDYSIGSGLYNSGGPTVGNSTTLIKNGTYDIPAHFDYNNGDSDYVNDQPNAPNSVTALCYGGGCGTDGNDGGYSGESPTSNGVDGVPPGNGQIVENNASNTFFTIVSSTNAGGSGVGNTVGYMTLSYQYSTTTSSIQSVSIT